MKTLFATVTAIAVAGVVLAGTPTIDGLNIDATNWSGPAIAIQDTNTGFGDNWNELNRMFVDADNGNLYIGLTGNLADNNALTIMIDTDLAAGSHPFVTEPGAAVPCVGVYPRLLRYYNGARLSDPNLPAVFTPDYALTISVGTFPGQWRDELVLAADLVDLNAAQLVDGVTILGIGREGTGNGTLSGATDAEIALDNRNTGGVGEWYTPGGETPAQTGDDPNEVTTGLEIALPRDLVGLDTALPTEVSFWAYISDNAGGGDSWPGVCDRRAWGSNQAMPGLAGWGNMAEFNGVLPPDPNSKVLDLQFNPLPNIASKTVPGVTP